MATKLDITNLALVNCGQRTLQSPTEDTSDSRLVSQVWKACVEAVIRSAPFTSASKRVELALLPTTPVFQYTYEYQQPADCLRIFECYRGDSYDKSLEWRLEGKKVLSDQSPLYVRYAFAPDDERDYDPLLVEAFAFKLASTIAYSKTESRSLAEALDVKYERALQEAKSIDSLQNQERYGFEEISWVDSHDCYTI